MCTSRNWCSVGLVTADKETIVADAKMPISAVIETDSSHLITKDGNEIAVEGERHHCKAEDQSVMIFLQTHCNLYTAVMYC